MCNPYMCLLPLAIKHTSQVDMSASRDFSTWINLEMGRWQAIYILDGNEGSLSFEFGAFANSSLGKAESMSSRKNLKRFGMMSFQDIQWKLESESHHLMPFHFPQVGDMLFSNLRNIIFCFS